VPKITEDQAASCDNALTLNEICIALREMANNKTPGNDGLPKEFYILAFDKLGPHLLKCLNACHEHGQMTISQRQAVVKLIQKPGKDSRLLKSWRPESLLNVDLKYYQKYYLTEFVIYYPISLTQINQHLLPDGILENLYEQ
jgi:hypothetical protein